MILQIVCAGHHCNPKRCYNLRMRVLLVSPYGAKVNPYIGLFRDGLAAAGAHVGESRELAPAQIGGVARPDVIHLHWLEALNQPPPVRVRGARRLLNSRAVREVRRGVRLAALLRVLLAFQGSGGCVATTVHNLDPHEGGGMADRWALAALLRKARIVHVHDASTAAEIDRRYGRTAGVTVIPHGHYIAAYPNQVGRDEARRLLDLPRGAFVYVCLGLLRPYKGLEELLPAFRQLCGEQLRLVVAGRPKSPSYTARLASLADGDARIRLEPRFIPVEEVQRYLNAADIAVLPYRQITTSGAALLAFSFGLPVIAPALGAFPNLVSSERGILYEGGRLVQAMTAAQAGSWAAARAPILDWVRQFDWEEIGRRLVAAYGTEG